MLHDPKILLLPDAIKWRWISVLLMAGAGEDNGYLPSHDYAAVILRVAPETYQAEMRMLAGQGLVELRTHDDGSERWYITKYTDRQAASTDSQRMREYRKRKKEESTKEERKKIQEKDTEAETETYRRVTSVTQPLQHVTANDVDDDADLAAKSAGIRILKRWQILTGRTAPRDDDEWAREWYAPVNQLWARLGKNEDAAFEAMRAQRQEMVNSGKTPFRPSAVVPYAMAAMDKTEVVAGTVYDKGYFSEA
jgi:hypothetical protein